MDLGFLRRLERNRVKVTPVTPVTSGLGPFLSVLPQEILHELFDYLPLGDVGNLALASRELRSVVAEWVPSRRCLARSQPRRSASALAANENLPPKPVNLIIESLIQQLRAGNGKINPFAVLCKRMTCLYNSRERLRYALQMFNKSISFVPAGKGDEKRSLMNPDWKLTEETMRFMDMVHTFVRGWDESEFPLVLRELDRKFGLAEKYRKVTDIANRQEACLSSEMDLRLYTRCLAWDLAGNDYGHRSAWILAIMNFFLDGRLGDFKKAKGQATVLVLMFGPACADNTSHYTALHQDEIHPDLTPQQRTVISEINNHTDWSAYTENVADNFHQGKSMFYGLAQAVCSCLSASPTWKSEMCVDVVDALFVTPKPWLRQNEAGFLLFCSESLIIHYFRTKLQRGLRAKVAQQLAQMVLVSQKFDNELCHERGIGKVFDAIVREAMAIAKSHKIKEEAAKGSEEAETWCQDTTNFSTLVWNNFVEDVVQAEEEDEDIESIEIIRSFGAHVMETLSADLASKTKEVEELKDELKQAESPRTKHLRSSGGDSHLDGPKTKKLKIDPDSDDEMELVPSTSDEEGSDNDFQAED